MAGKASERYYAYMRKASLTPGSILNWGLLCVLPLFFIPFHQNPFLPSKLCALAVTVFLALFMLVWNGRRFPQADRPLYSVSLSFLTLAILVVISTAFSINPARSLFGAFGRYQGALTWMLYLACLFLGASTWRKEEDRQFTAPLAVSTIVAGAYGIVQALGADFLPKAASYAPFGLLRASGTFETASFLGAFLVLSLPILTAAYLARRRLLFATAATAGAIALILTFSRGAWLGVLFGLLVALVLAEKHTRRKFLIGGAGLLAVSALLYLIAFHFDRSSTATGRLALWRSTAPAIAAKPLLGFGPDTALDRLPSLITPEFERFSNATNKAADRSFLPDRAHTFLIDIASDLGIPFLLALLGLAGIFLARAKNSVRQKRGLNYEVLGLAAAVNGYFFALLFHFFSPDTAPIFFLLLGRSLALTEGKSERKIALHPAVIPSGLAVITAIAVIASLLSLFSSYEVSLALRAYKQENTEGIRSNFNRARALTPWESEIDLIEGRTWFLLAKKSRSASSIPLAITALQRASGKAPHDERPLMWLGNARVLEYELTGGNDGKELDRAATAYRKVLRMDPNYSALHLQLGVVAYYRKDIKGAVREWKQAYSLAPKSTAALKNLAIAYEKLGETAKAMEAKEKIDVLNTP